MVLEVNQIDIESLQPYANNPRKLSDKAITKVANSIKEFGFRQPIVVDEKNIIVVGHTRYQAARKLGLDKVPVTQIKGLTPEQVNAYRIADNKTNEYADWDDDLLALELKELEHKDFDLDLTGYEKSEIDKILFEEKQGLVDDDEIPEPPEEPISQKGDIWILGNNKLLCGDSTDQIAIQGFFGEVQADLYLTDPPYNVDYVGKTKDALKIQNDKQTDDKFIQFLSDAFIAADNHLKMGASFYIWHSDSEGLNFRLACINAKWKLRQTLIWEKNSMVMGRQDYQWQHEPCLYGWKEGSSHSWYSDRKQTTIIKHDRPTKSKLHPTMKPVSLMEYLINNSTKQGDIVFDSFCGSGSTLIACEKLQRSCYGVELDPKYCDVIVKRWEQWTGQKATKK
jgi:site-specific DNA-methyltransferase (adenine-specific)